MANVKANLSRNYTTGEKRIERNVLLENQIISIPQLMKLTNQLVLAEQALSKVNNLQTSFLKN
jgi:hypothetical protein